MPDPAQAPKYSKPPVVEALFDIKVELPKAIMAADLEALHSQIQDLYPTKKARRGLETSLQFKEGEPPSTESRDLGISGYLFWSKDEEQLVQFRLDGFSFNRLKPYKKWQERLPEAQRLWNIYATALKPILATRVALRYINQFNFTEGRADQYLNFLPPIETDKMGSLSQFFSRTVINLPESDATAILTQGSDPSLQTPSSLLLDIDVFSNVQLKPDSGQLWDLLLSLRNQANGIFEESVTAKAKELFK